MNDGKICISICAGTAEELFRQIRSAETADIVEARFDCLDPGEILPALARVSEEPDRFRQFLLATFRNEDQGGKRKISDEERFSFWFGGHDCPFWGGDFEEDIVAKAVKSRWVNRICSYHDFSDEPPDVVEIYDRLRSTPATHVKIAIRAEKITDAIPLWDLLEKARSERKPLIPVAMGEAGKWTRILGLAHGAFMTYASPSSGAETAPGQISAKDMAEVFRVKELDRNTEVFGIVAGDSTYSVSPWMHNAAFKAAGMNRVFIPLQVEDLDEFIRRMVNPETREVELNFKGFSVTNPHKQAIIEHLDAIDETAKKIGAVNTVKIEDGKLFGYNTDAPGFIAPLKKALGDIREATVAVIGAGGAARACIYSLRQEGANVILLARDPEKAAALAAEFNIAVRQYEISNLRSKISGWDVIVNATPLGTKGENENKTIARAEDLKDVKLVYDLIYNPSETRLIAEARAAGVPAIGGLEMLIAQGTRQFEIWTGEKAPSDAMAAAVKKKLNL